MPGHNAADIRTDTFDVRYPCDHCPLTGTLAYAFGEEGALFLTTLFIYGTSDDARSDKTFGAEDFGGENFIGVAGIWTQEGAHANMGPRHSTQMRKVLLKTRNTY